MQHDSTQPAVTTKITPAMENWCRAIADLTSCRIVRSTTGTAPAWKHYRTEGLLRIPKPTWAMADKLVEAGLIDWTHRGDRDRYREHVAVLTEKGREVAGRDVEGAAVRLSGWPFPVSAHIEGKTP